MNKDNNCPSCGAPITTEVCPYCNVFTGLKSSDANMEYPVIECKEAHVGFWNVVFPMIFNIMGPFGHILAPLLFLAILFAGITSALGFF